jgi:hypothetical protein
MVTTAVPAAEGHRLRSLRGWVIERGILYALLETPILAVLGGFFYRLVPYPFASLSVLAAFVALPIWVSHRRAVSTDPDEPVHHLHTYAVYALLPGAVFTVARIPANVLFGVIYWHPWYDFGSALTGAPVGRYSSLLAGAVLNALQGWSIGVGFYVLFKRHSLLNAILYIGVYDSALYSFVFPTYSRVGLPSPPLWHAVMAWGHFWMAVTAWFMPRFHHGLWPRLAIGARGAAVTAGAVVFLLPTGYACWRATAWQFPLAESIDRATFSRPGLLALHDGPALAQVGPEAHYRYSLRFGPRTYRNYFKQARALDAGPVQVTGRLSRDGQVIAWCSTYVPRLDSPNRILVPPDFWPALQRLDYTDIPVGCLGPPTAVSDLAAEPQVTVEWSAQVTLIGDREQRAQEFRGSESRALRIMQP